MEPQSSTVQQEPEDNNNNNGNNGQNDDNEDNDDPLVWSRDLEKHSCGEFSYALVQVNTSIQEHSQIEVAGSNAIFIGIYDGCNGPRASWFILNYLMTGLTRNARKDETIDEETLRDAILTTDGSFMYCVHLIHPHHPSIVLDASSCLVCVIWKGTLIIGHVGTSRAVCGMINPSDNSLNAVQLTMEHNVNNLLIRQQYLDSHDHDPYLLVCNQGVWSVKGITQVSKFIWHANLKLSTFQDPRCHELFRLSSPLRRPAIEATPYMYSRPIEASDRFFIFASLEFWNHMTIHRAVEIVHTNPINGIARRLLMTALREAARKANVRFNSLALVSLGWRLGVHDDMTVIVVFVGVRDDHLDQKAFKGLFSEDDSASAFLCIDDLM